MALRFLGSPTIRIDGHDVEPGADTRHGAELLFQVLTEREEKASVAIASNESFSKAHMFA